MKMNDKRNSDVWEKGLLIFISALGLLTVFIGMYRDQDLVFIIGIIFIVSSYLYIRKRLKESMRKEDIVTDRTIIYGKSG
jgi:hypothetical protein